MFHRYIHFNAPRNGSLADCAMVVLASCALLAAVAPARGQCSLNELAKLTAADGAQFDQFCASVSISGDTMLVGAKGDDDAGLNSGSAYVFTRSGGVWMQQAKLVAADGAEFDEFGVSVSVSGDTAIVGADVDDDAGPDTGSAYVFTRSGGVWTQQAKLTDPREGFFDYFGISVSISGDTAVIGEIRDTDDEGFVSGTAHVFTRSGGVWTHEARLTAADGGFLDFFGVSVSISGDTVVVGRDLDDDAGSDSGSAYVFTRSGGVWTQQAKLTAADAAAGDRFGFAVSVSDDTAVIGARGNDDAGSDSGSAYVFTRSGGVWMQQAKLTAADAAADDKFGFSVSVSGNKVIVGAHGDDGAGANSGSAYMFMRSGGVWMQQAELTATDADAEDNLGFSVSVDGETAVAGAIGGGAAGLSSGSAYVFSSTDGDGDDVPDGCDQCPGADDNLDTDGDGIADACDNCSAAPNSGQEDCDANGIGDACETDCDSNGVPDSCQSEVKLIASDAATADNFGRSISVSGNTAVVGAYLDDHVRTDSGSAYVYTRIGGVWTEQAKLIAADAAANDLFGHSVSVSGDTAVVGAYFDDDAGFDSGSAYVFARSGGVWTQQAKLTAADASAYHLFGHAVSVSGDTALVGAYWDDHAGFATGSAYVFTRSGGVWTQQAKLTAADAAASDNFGSSLSVSGDTAIVGAHRDDDTGSDSGSVYVFTRSGGVWTQQAKLTAADAAANDWFGYSVSLSGDQAIIGALLNDDAGANSGSAYVFTRSGGVWTQQAKLTATDAAPADQFGIAVSVSGDTAVVGAYFDDDAGIDAGSVYVFTRTSGIWTQHVKFTAADAAPGDNLGGSVAVSGDTVVVGASANDDAGLSSGSAHVFIATDPDRDLIPDDCDNCPLTANSGQQDLDGDGIGDACDSCPNRMIGDVNGDSFVDIADVTPFAGVLLGSEAATPDEHCAADTNKDGIADGLDMPAFVQLLLAS